MASKLVATDPRDWALFCREMAPEALEAFAHVHRGHRIFRTSWASRREAKAPLFLFVALTRIYVRHIDGTRSPYVPVLEDAWADDWQHGSVPSRGDV